MITQIQIINSPMVFSILLTIVIYIGAKFLSMHVVSPLTTPVLTSTIIIIAILMVMDIPYEAYQVGTEVITYLLGPATVALAIPLYHNREVIKGKLKPAMTGLTIGILSTIASAVWLSKAFGFSGTIQASSAVKAVTTPVAIETVVLIGGSPTLAAAFVIAAGIFGAVFGPFLLTLMKISDPFSRGLGVGTVAHGIGTSQVVVEGSLQGAVSSMAMGLAAIITALVLPWIYPFL